MNLAAEKGDTSLTESAAPAQPEAGGDAPPPMSEAPSPALLPRLHATQQLRILLGSMIGAAIIVAVLLATKMVIPGHVASQLMSETEDLKRQNDALIRAREQTDAKIKQSEAKIRQYEKQLADASPEKFKTEIAEMQATIQGLEQQIEAVRASEWPPLASEAQDALYDVLKDLPVREVWVGYADSGGRDLAKTFSEVFRRLSWPQKYDILAVVDPQEGLWITPISDFSEEVRDRIRQSTGLEFKLFPHREQLPDAKQIGIIIGYRTAKEGNVP